MPRPVIQEVVLNVPYLAADFEECDEDMLSLLKPKSLGFEQGDEDGNDPPSLKKMVSESMEAATSALRGRRGRDGMMGGSEEGEGRSGGEARWGPGGGGGGRSFLLHLRGRGIEEEEDDEA